MPKISQIASKLELMYMGTLIHTVLTLPARISAEATINAATTIPTTRRLLDRSISRMK